MTRPHVPAMRDDVPVSVHVRRDGCLAKTVVQGHKAEESASGV